MAHESARESSTPPDLAEQHQVHNIYDNMAELVFDRGPAPRSAEVYHGLEHKSVQNRTPPDIKDTTASKYANTKSIII